MKTRRKIAALYQKLQKRRPRSIKDSINTKQSTCLEFSPQIVTSKTLCTVYIGFLLRPTWTQSEWSERPAGTEAASGSLGFSKYAASESAGISAELPAAPKAAVRLYSGPMESKLGCILARFRQTKR
jgi:hypothetical protein